MVTPAAAVVPPPSLPAQPSNAAAITVPAATNRMAFPETWIPLERWSQAYGFGVPRRVGTEGSAAYVFGSTNGTMAVRMGSQLAYWNGLEYRLGFAPQLIDGRPYIHYLDVRKNFLPLLENTARLKSKGVIVLDPGHGGTDIGTQNVFDGRYEKEFTLDWARRLQALLSVKGWTVWLTRTSDVNVAISNRVAFAEQHQADLFLSLHFNSAFPDREQSGLETYCMTPTGMPSNLTRGYADNTALIFPNNRFDAQNLLYAVELHRALLTVNGHADRGVRRARFLGVLQGQNRPAVLVEGGYLSNLKEARQVADPAYRQKLAEALAQAIGEDSGIGTNLLSQSPATPTAPNPGGRFN